MDSQPSQLTSLDLLWSSSVESAHRSDTLALLAGRNFRIDIFKAFKAAYETVKAYSEAQKYIASHFTDIGAGSAAMYSAICAVRSALCALSESIQEDAYVACMVLASNPNGIQEQQLQTDIENFIRDATGKSFPWYTGLTQSRLKIALEKLKKRKAGELVKYLCDNELSTAKDGSVKYTPKHYVVGLGEAN